MIVKLTPNVTDIASTAKAAVRGGADGICAINTVSSLIGVDIDSLSPLPNVNGYSTYGGLSGACVKPIGLRCVAEIAKCADVPIYAAGGISNWKDSVEYIAVGANILQICTEVMFKGISIIDDLKQGLSEYLNRKTISTIEDIRGAALSKLTTHFELSRSYKLIAQINSAKCWDCGSCMTVCSESASDAIYKEHELMKIDCARCSGCSLCVFICPNHSISMIQANA